MKGSLAKKIGLGILSALTWPFRAVFNTVFTAIKNIAMTTQEILQHLIGAVIVLSLLMFLTYNPWGGSYTHWIIGDGTQSIGSMSLLQIWIGFLIVVLWGAALWWSLSPLGVIGTLIIVALVGSGFAVAVSSGYINVRESSTIVFLTQVTIVLALAIGATAAMARKKATAQVSVDNVDDVVDDGV